MNYLATYGTISQVSGEAIEQVLSLKAKIKGKCFGPSRSLQEEVRSQYEREIGERLKLISRLIVDLGSERPQRFAVALSRLSLNLGEAADQLVTLLYIPGYRGLQKVTLALLDHIQRSLYYFRKKVTGNEEPTTFNLNYLLRDLGFVICPFRSGLMPVGDERMVQLNLKEKLDEEVPHMFGEPASLYLAFYQLLLNAVTAAGKGGTVSVYTKYFEHVRQLQVTVADSGDGIDRLAVLKSALETETLNPLQADAIRRDASDHNNKAFELIFLPRVSVFGQTDSRHKGIGLTLAQEEILRHKGKIEIHSKSGRGTTFQIFFNIK